MQKCRNAEEYSPLYFCIYTFLYYTSPMRPWIPYTFTVLLCSLVLAVLMQGPQWLHQMHPLARGIAVSLNSDEAIYLARVQESLSGRPEQTAEAFVGDPELTGTQFAIIERFYGSLFRFTGWRAADVLTVLDAVIPVLIFLSLIVFFRVLGLPKWYALAFAAGFCLLQLYNLNRPIHMRSSFLLMLWALITMMLSLRSKWWIPLAGGLLGLLVGVYVWSFMFAWAFWGVFFAWESAEWLYVRWKEYDRKKHSLLAKAISGTQKILSSLPFRSREFSVAHWHILLAIGAIGVIAAAPFVQKYIALQHHPLYDYGSFRSGMHKSHLPESLIYSGLFLFAVLASAVAHVRSYETLRPYRPAFALLLAACVYMNQQVVHGITFNFVSHGIFSIVLAAISVLAVTVLTRKYVLIVACIPLAVYLAAIGYDGRFVLGQWEVKDTDFESQYLVDSLPILDDLPRGRFVSDPGTLAFIAGYTHHDIVYSIYLKNVLMTHEELAKRYCLTQIPVPQEKRAIRSTMHLIMPDASSAFGERVRTQEVSIVEAACRQVDKDPLAALKEFGVTHILWNGELHPEWDMQRFQAPLKVVYATNEWVLYQLEQ